MLFVIKAHFSVAVCLREQCYITSAERQDRNNAIGWGRPLPRLLRMILVLLLSVSFLVACGEDKPAEFRLSSVIVSPSTATVNDTVTILATVANVGEVSGGCNVSLTIDGYTDSKSISPLAGDESDDISFTYQAALQYFGSQKTVIRRIHLGKLPARFENWGKRYIIDVQDVLRYLGIDPDKSIAEIALKDRKKR